MTRTDIQLEASEIDLELYRVGERRADAIAKGEEFYFSGRSCVNGNVSKRATISGDCLECRRTNREREKKRFAEAIAARTQASE